MCDSMAAWKGDLCGEPVIMKISSCSSCFLLQDQILRDGLVKFRELARGCASSDSDTSDFECRNNWPSNSGLTSKGCTLRWGFRRTYGNVHSTLFIIVLPHCLQVLSVRESPGTAILELRPDHHDMWICRSINQSLWLSYPYHPIRCCWRCDIHSSRFHETRGGWGVPGLPGCCGAVFAEPSASFLLDANHRTRAG